MRPLQFCSITAVSSLALLGLTTPPTQGQFVEPEVEVLYSITGASSEFYGYVANRVRDIDGDGADEILVGAPYYLDGLGQAVGRAYLISGRTGTQLHVFEGLPAEYMGASVNDAGDVNNDGITDLIIGSPGQPFTPTTNVRGRTSVFSGADFTQLWTTSGAALNDIYGHSVAGLKDDLNGDSFLDVITTATRNDSAFTNAGRAYVLSGLDGSTLSTFDGLTSSDLLGTGADSIQDLDGDGIRDVVATARDAGPDLKGRGYVWGSASGSLIHELMPNITAVNFGWFFTAGVGDVDADGTEDIYVPDFEDTALGSTTGRAYVFSGATGAKIREWQGEAELEGFGIGRGAGDVNGDGYADLFMASWISNFGAPAAGKGFVLSGKDSTTLRTMTCNLAGAQLGYDATGLGDVNGDGAADYLLTGVGSDAASIANFDGAIFVIAGIPDAVPCEGDANGDEVVDPLDSGYVQARFGCAVGSGDDLCDAADVNADGVVDPLDVGYVLARFGQCL